jgi:hypothetical protein
MEVAAVGLAGQPLVGSGHAAPAGSTSSGLEDPIDGTAEPFPVLGELLQRFGATVG